MKGDKLMDEKYDRPENRSQASPNMPMGECCSRERVKELMVLADTIAVLVEQKTTRRERCRLRRMVEMLLDAE